MQENSVAGPKHLGRVEQATERVREMHNFSADIWHQAKRIREKHLGARPESGDLAEAMPEPTNTTDQLHVMINSTNEMMMKIHSVLVDIEQEL